MLTGIYNHVEGLRLLLLAGLSLAAVLLFIPPRSYLIAKILKPLERMPALSQPVISSSQLNNPKHGRINDAARVQRPSRRISGSDQKLLAQAPELEARFFSYFQGIEHSWKLLLDHDGLSVQTDANAAYCFRIECVLKNTTAATVFDLFHSVSRRPDWDSTCETAKEIRKIDGALLRLVYVKMKPQWPTAGRDAVLLVFSKKFDDGRYMMAAKSVELEEYPPDPTGSIVRMYSKLTGQVITPISGTDSCRLQQIVDGDPKGYIPSSIVKFVATKMLPASINQLQKLLEEMPKRVESNVLGQIDEEGTSHDNDPMLRILESLNKIHARIDAVEAQLCAIKVQQTTVPLLSIENFARFSPIILSAVTLTIVVGMARNIQSK